MVASFFFYLITRYLSRGAYIRMYPREVSIEVVR